VWGWKCRGRGQCRCFQKAEFAVRLVRAFSCKGCNADESQVLLVQPAPGDGLELSRTVRYHLVIFSVEEVRSALDSFG